MSQQEAQAQQQSLWKQNKWPLQFLERDEKSARFFVDNGIFQSMQFFGHEWQWDDQLGLLIPCAPNKHYKPWDEIKNDLTIMDNNGIPVYFKNF